MDKEDKFQVALGLRVQCPKCKGVYKAFNPKCALCAHCCVHSQPPIECVTCKAKYGYGENKK